MKSKKSNEKKIEKLYNLFDGQWNLHISNAGCWLLDGWEAWPDHSEEHDHDHTLPNVQRDEDISMAGSSSPEKPMSKAVDKTSKAKEGHPVTKVKGKSNGHHDHHHHHNGREKKAKIARAH
jgi:hypothetical protein